MSVRTQVFNPFLRFEARASEDPIEEAEDIYWSDSASAWIVTRFADSKAVLHDDDRFVAYDLSEAFNKIAARSGTPLPHIHAFLEASLIFRGGSDHTALRRLLSRMLNSQPLSSLSPVMRTIAERLWRESMDDGRLDVVKDFAEPLPSLVIAELLGLDEQQRLAFYEHTYGLMGVYNRGCSLSSYRRFEVHLRELRTTIDALFSSRRADPRRDGATRFLQEAARLDLSDDAAAANLTFLYLASVDQTSAMIALAVRTLLRQQELLAALRAKTADLAAVVEELLRIESPAPQAIRVATEDVEIGGARMARGDVSIVLLSTANRDAERFSLPDQIGAGRKDVRHLAFSDGAHACIGAAFARVEIVAALETFLDRPPIAVLTASPEWWPLDATRRMRSFEVSFS